MEVQRGGRTNIQELDVVRALHQTVVSLRSALEASRTELKDLRHKYESHVCADKKSQIDKSNNNKDTKELEIDQLQEDKQDTLKKVTFNLEQEQSESIEDDTANNNIEQKSSSDVDNENIEKVDSEIKICNEINVESVKPFCSVGGVTPRVEEVIIKNEETTIKETQGEFETKVELESKFDVTIKVSALKPGDSVPIVIETNDCELLNINTSDTKDIVDSGGAFRDVESFRVIHDETFVIDATSDFKNISNMAGSKEGNTVSDNNDKLNIHLKITSEEDLLLDSYKAKDQPNPEPDEISVRSFSEGDNSVFSEIVAEDDGVSKTCDQENMSGNESEEVDDIELIFTTDDTKEFTGFQEDLVSISEGDHWTGERSDVATPVLLKFNVFDPDSRRDSKQLDNREKQLAEKTQSITKKGILRKDGHEDIGTNAQDKRFVDKRPFLRTSSSKNYLETTELKNVNRKSFESNDSFSFDNQKSFSFDNTKSSSFERGSSIDAELRELSFDHRDESMDQFDTVKTTMKTQYTVCVETDISKCGMPEDDGFSENIAARRNTCPNPFQYRPLSHREVFRGGARPLLAPPPGQRVPRRSSAAQTHISALPTQWRSDTHLSKKTLPLALTTLPSKVRMEELSTGGAPLMNRSLKSSRKSEEARRVLLSDIGFTSMVPELSRSAEPIWAGLGPGAGPLCCVQHANCLASVPCSPTSPCKETGHSRYWSKGSMQHSFLGKICDSSSGPHKLGYLEQGMRWRGSLPELRPITARCGGTKSSSKQSRLNDSEDSTDELLDEADRFLRSSIGCLSITRTNQDEFCPSQYSRPYLPSGPRQLRLGHLVKVITPHGRIALGKVKYVGVAGGPWSGSGSAPTYVGILVGSGVSLGASGGDGTYRGRRYFHCEPGRSLFVPFSKVVMAWADF